MSKSERLLSVVALCGLCATGAAAQQEPPEPLVLQLGRSAVERDLQVTPPCPSAWRVAFTQARITQRGSPQDGIWPVSVTTAGTMSCDWLGRRMNYRFEADALVRASVDDGGRWSDAGSDATNENMTPFAGGDTPRPPEAGPKPAAPAGGGKPGTNTLRADLERLLRAQEVYYSTHHTYAGAPGARASFALGPGRYHSSRGVRVTIREAGTTGWSAEAQPRAGGARCTLFVGKAKPLPPATQVGLPGCAP